MKNAKWLLTVMILAMLGYQAWRVFDYMQGSLQGVDPDTAWWVAIFFLAFTEVGLLAWLHIGVPGATTDTQETVGNVMVWVDYGGSMVLGLADLAKHNTLYIIDLGRLDPILFFAPFVVVAANVAAFIVYKNNDSKERLEKAERRLKHMEHALEIKARQEAIGDLTANIDGLARTLAPHYVKDISDRVTGRTAKRFGRQAAKLNDAEQPSPIQEADYMVPDRLPKPGLLDRAKAFLAGDKGPSIVPDALREYPADAALPAGDQNKQDGTDPT